MWSNSKGLRSGFLLHRVEWRPGADSVYDGQGCNALAPSQTLPGVTSYIWKLPCPGRLFTQWKQLLSAGCWADRRAEISHSVPSICVPTFPSRDIHPLQQGLPLDCSILPPLKVPNPFRRQENMQGGCKREELALTTSL